MKKIRVFIVLLGLLLLGACAASDSAETLVPSEEKDTRCPEYEEKSETDSKNRPKIPELKKTELKLADNSDRNKNSEGSKTSAAPQKAEESVAVKQQESSSRSGEDSQAAAASSEANQNESVKVAEEPKAPETPAEQPAVEPPAEPPAVTQQPEPEPIVPEEPVQPPAQPEIPKTIYDFAFDANAIRAELIAIGQSMGLAHITEDDGIPCTPDTCSWAAPVTASESFQGDNLKRALKDYVTSMPSIIGSYGGAQLTSFTIYVQDNGGGSYTFYFLY
ncbi:hypothetical protein EBB54_10370 [Schaedlerella arabinosiphila]|jgi:hypothetical protein|uniref:Uncharacterized protein n=1 Tax=Schaedlerella arabinosiphila TaxID=2044587 RepID=A0A3R8R441_9FIRM|nr:hypothetical protein [Schaedlerella arabinosiphila]RRK31723.1 hypothetical protein EBB54_10370 [Schaedlerella arabinosiphila]